MMEVPIEFKEVIVSGSVIGAKELKRLITENQIISDFGLGIDKQLQPEGFDLTVREIRQFNSIGKILKEKSVVSETKPAIDMYWDGAWHLDEGQYQILFNEVLKLPRNVHVFTIQRSSVPRSGCIMHVGSFDAGYTGRGVMTIFVGKQGITIEKDAALVQAHFFYVIGKNFGYKGQYQNENL